MTIAVDTDWWKHIFDATYLLTDGRSVCDDELTRSEVDFIEETLRPQRSDPILDLCGGQGRHSLELSSRGFTDVTVLDYSQYLIDCGEKQARQEELGTVFIRGDARDTGLPRERFKFVIVMASSFGYFADDEENGKIVGEAFRVLMDGGTLLLDLPNRDYVLRNFKPSSQHRITDDIVVRRERELSDDVIYSREIVMSERRGCIRDQQYLTCLYSAERISALLHGAGFSSVTCRKDFMNRDATGDYGSMTNRMVVTAQK